MCSGHGDRLQTRGAEPVDRNRRNSIGKPGALAGDAGNVHPRFGFGHCTAENHILDVLRVESGHAANRFIDCNGSKVVGPRRAQGALGGLPDGGAYGTYDDGVSHVGDS